LRALYRSGERKAALDLVEPLWVQGKSQPKACDSLFKTWIDAGYLDDRIVWQRIVLALEKNEVTLAKYLRTLLTTDTFKRHGKAIYDAHVRPQTRFNPGAHTSDNEINRAVLSAGLLRLARKDPAKALEIWSKARSRHSFTDAMRAKIESRLYIEAAEEKIYPALNEQPTALSDAALIRIGQLPGFERSLELYAVDDLINAKREWLRAFADLSANQKAAAALFAQHGVGSTRPLLPQTRQVCTMI